MNAPLRLPLSLEACATADRLGRLAARALAREAMLTPKPGLVDRANSGAHDDMDLSTFLVSARALAPRFPAFFREGCALAAAPPSLALAAARPLGMACERAMSAATDGVNTHKGAIFAFGVTLTACGRLWARGARLDVATICAEVARMCAGLVAREMAGEAAPSAGVAAFRAHGFAGARGEAEAGFPLVRERALPALRAARARGAGRDEALLLALLALLDHAADTNLLARGGPDAIAFVRAGAAAIPRDLSRDALVARLVDLDRALIARRLSPGGSADLLALTWFLDQLERRHSSIVGTPRLPIRSGIADASLAYAGLALG